MSNLSSRNIFFLSPSDRFNYGDLLFSMVAKNKFSVIAPSCKISNHALVVSDLSRYGALPTKSIRDLFSNGVVKDGDSIVFTGGGTIGVDWIYMYSNLLGRSGNLALYYAKRLFGSDFLNKLCRYRLGAPTEFPWLAQPGDFPTSVRVAYNSIGGSELARLPKEVQEKTLSVLETATFISVRDLETKRIFSPVERKVEVHLAPDSATIMSDQYPLSWLERNVSEAVKNIFEDGNCLCFQANLRFVMKNFEEILRALEDIYKKFGLKSVLLPIGRYVGLDDHMAMKKIADGLATPVDLIDSDATVWEIMYSIAKSNFFMGTSLHGNITAQSFSVPHFGLIGGPSKLEYYLNTWDLPEQSKCVDISSVSSRLNDVLGIDLSKRNHLRNDLVSRINNNFNEIKNTCNLG